MQKRHKDALSNTSLKNYNPSKYNKVSMTRAAIDEEKFYEIRRDGWRRRRRSTERA